MDRPNKKDELNKEGSNIKGRRNMGFFFLFSRVFSALCQTLPKKPKNFGKDMYPGKQVIKMWSSGSTKIKTKNKEKSVFLLTLSADISRGTKNIQTLSEWAEQDSLGLENIWNLEAVA